MVNNIWIKAFALAIALISAACERTDCISKVDLYDSTGNAEFDSLAADIKNMERGSDRYNLIQDANNNRLKKAHAGLATMAYDYAMRSIFANTNSVKEDWKLVVRYSEIMRSEADRLGFSLDEMGWRDNIRPYEVLIYGAREAALYDDNDVREACSILGAAFETELHRPSGL